MTRPHPIFAIGTAALSVVEFVGGLGWLLFDTFRLAPRSLLGKRGRRMGWANLFAQMVRVGVKSVPVVMLVLFCIGAILSLQIAPILKSYGALPELARIIAVATFRELGPLVGAIVLTGFAGASIAAEVGTMVVTEEVEALEANAIHPVRFLVVPRVLATGTMMVCVAVVADLTGVAGGLAISTLVLDIGLAQYVNATFESIAPRDFITGLIKAWVFGTLISGLACFLGLRVTGGAEGVGDATTKTVVYTIIALIAVDLLFTTVFYMLGW